MVVFTIPFSPIIGKIATRYVPLSSTRTVTGPVDRCSVVPFIRSLWTSSTLFNCTIIWNPVTEDLDKEHIAEIVPSKEVTLQSSVSLEDITRSDEPVDKMTFS